MPSPEPAKSPVWGQVLSGVLLLSGIGLIAWSLILPALSNGRRSWSQEQARQYQMTAIRLHGLSHDMVHAAEQGSEEATRAELDKAQTEYDLLRRQLESAMARPRYIAWLLQIGGVLLAAAGVTGLFLLRASARLHDA